MNTNQGSFEDPQKEQEGSPSIASTGLSGDMHIPEDDIIELTDVIKKGEQFQEMDPHFQFENPAAEAEEKKQDILGPNDDDLEKIIAGLETELDTEEPEAEEQETDAPEPLSHEPAQSLVLSPEQIEAHLTEVVREVVEKVVRETVAEVTEKVIKEAINALKESLETQSE